MSASGPEAALTRCRGPAEASVQAASRIFAPPATSAHDCGSRLFATGELAQLGGQFYAIHMATRDDLDRRLDGPPAGRYSFDVRALEGYALAGLKSVADF
jgi:hypothetical protein